MKRYLNSVKKYTEEIIIINYCEIYKRISAIIILLKIIIEWTCLHKEQLKRLNEPLLIEAKEVIYNLK